MIKFIDLTFYTNKQRYLLKDKMLRDQIIRY
jgi:hypothetical protein